MVMHKTLFHWFEPETVHRSIGQTYTLHTAILQIKVPIVDAIEALYGGRVAADISHGSCHKRLLHRPRMTRPARAPHFSIWTNGYVRVVTALRPWVMPCLSVHPRLRSSFFPPGGGAHFTSKTQLAVNPFLVHDFQAG